MMKDKSIKEYLIECLFPDEVVGINENDGENEGSTGPAKPTNDPDKNAVNPDPNDLFSGQNSILFLTAPNKDGIIKRGESMGFIELNKKSIEYGLEVDLEDFQWWCTASDFEKYLDKTGRRYNSDTGEWTSESEEETPKRRISGYSDFLENRKDLNEADILDLLGGAKETTKGMEYTGKSPDFQKGKLTDSQRRFIQFVFARNALRNSGKIEDKLDLNSLKPGDPKEIFVSAFDPATGKSDETAIIGMTLKVVANIPADGEMASPIVVCHITQVAPNLGGEGGEGGFESVLEGVVQKLYQFYDDFMNVLDTSTGKIFATLGAISIMQGSGIIGGAILWWNLSSVRGSLKAMSGVQPGILAKGSSFVKRSALNFLKYPFKQGPKDLNNFLRRPFQIVKNYRTYKNTAFLNRGKKALKGWKLARYLLFGKKALTVAKTTVQVSRGARILGGLAKITNPIGWILLATDAIGSFMNYTSDNQAPSWDPIVGGEGDAMKKYASTKKGGSNLCPSASNVFHPKDIKTGETITLCWTQNPEKGWGLALSFVVSNSTRTTMNITKVYDFKGPNENSPSMSLFLINSVNYTGLWDKIKTYKIRFLFIKSNKYEEGYMDDNIGAYFLGGNASPDPKDVLPMAYYGHCDYVEFHSVYQNAPDQLTVISEDAPADYKFYFHDSESNPINVVGRKVNNKDIENASEEDINAFFDVQPVSSYIGNPEEETEEERIQREEAENSYSASMNSPEDEESEESDVEKTEEESETLAKNENDKWYSSIPYSKPIESFEDFKIVKESLLFENDGDEDLPGSKKGDAQELPTGEKSGESAEGEKEDPSKVSISDRVLTSKQFYENFQKILDTVEAPFEFAIYFVQDREYANPELRDIYKPGSFTNFHITQDALSASDNSSIEGEVQVNNLDFLIDPRRGQYSLSSSEREDNKKEEDPYLGVKATDDILTPDVISAEKRKSVTDDYVGKEKEDKNLGVIQRVDPDVLKYLDISGWGEITKVKVIKDEEGNPEVIKINNKKAAIGDKLRRFEKGDPNFEEAIKIAKAYEDKKKDEEELEQLAKR